MEQIKIGSFIKELRKEQNLTQEELAEKFNVARRTFSRWESVSNMPDLDFLIEMADFYDVDLREILDGERKSEKMEKELKETVLKVAEYSNSEKEVKRQNMKEIILSADGDSIVYLVPDDVANNLREYCIEFCDKWLWTSPKAKCYRTQQGVCFNESDFIDYLNKYIFPTQKSIFVKNLGWTDLGEKLPLEYQGHPYFNF